MLALLGMIPGLLSIVTSLANGWFSAKVAIFQAKTGAAEGVAVAALQAQAQIQTRWWFASIPMTIIGFTVATYVAKCILWDKVVGSFVGCSGSPPKGTCITFATDALSQDQTYILMAVVVSYFGAAMVDKFLGMK